MHEGNGKPANLTEAEFLAPDGERTGRIAYLRRRARPTDGSRPGVARPGVDWPGVDWPGVVWLGGFRSDMRATKAEALDAWAAERGRAMLRFDYSGHGESDGDFAAGTISRWLADTLAAIAALTDGPQILVGSSMGGWLALLAARCLAAAAAPPAGLVLLAPAVDFTERLLWANFDHGVRRAIEADGVHLLPSEYGSPVPITRELIADGRRHLLFDTEIRAHAPVHILQGMADTAVPWRHAMTLVEHLASDPVAVTLVKDGDHRLSRPADIARLLAAVEGIATG